MASLKILEKLADPINNAVSQSDNPSTLAPALNEALSGWFKDNVFPLMTGVAIFITVLFVFYGAFLYFTAYGDENRATQAKKTLTYAVVGFAIAALAFSIANYSKRLFITRDYETNNNSNAGIAGTVENEDLDAPVNVEGGDIPEQNPYEPPNVFQDIN